MHDGSNCQQLILFPKQLAWHELPKNIRDRTIDLVTTLCVEIVTESPSGIQEHDDERAED
jgi:hypothetical protein